MFKRILNQLKEFLKKVYEKKDIKVRDTGTLYAKYLTKRKYRLMGIKNIVNNGDEAVLTDKKKNEFIIVEVILKKKNKVNDEQERENYKQVERAKENIFCDLKTVMVSEKSDLLKDNIEYIESLYYKESDPEIKADILEELQYAKELNQLGKTNEYIFVPLQSLSEVIEKLSIPYYVKTLNYEQTLDVLFKILN